MTRWSPLVAALALVVTPAAAGAVERQLQLGARAGFAWSSGTHAGPGAAVDLTARWGLNDAFNLYANGSWAVAFPDVARNSPRHGGALSVGVVYAFDYLRVVPFVGVGARADLFHTPNTTWWSPSAEARLGVTWLLRRELAIDLEAAYAFPFLDRERTGDLVTVTAGALLLLDR